MKLDKLLETLKVVKPWQCQMAVDAAVFLAGLYSTCSQLRSNFLN